MSAALDLIERARDDAQSIAIHFWGEPNKALSTSRELRWGEHGKLALTLIGTHRGKWRDWSDNDRHGDALDLIEQERNCERAEALDWCREWFGGVVAPIDHAKRDADRKAAQEEEERARKARIRSAGDIWRASVALVGSPAERYLLNRLCGFAIPTETIDGDAIRWHAGERIPGAIGAMVALMTDPATGKPCGIHRTYLDSSAAKLDRKMLGQTGVVRLSPDDSVTTGLAIAEGIETALSAQILFDSAPMWAALNAGNLACFPVLGGIEALTIYADNDPEKRGRRAGPEAAQECADRWGSAGREVIIRTPKTVERDFNDTLKILTSKGVAA